MKQFCYVGKNPLEFPFIQLNNKVYNLLQGGWHNQKTGKRVTNKMRDKLTYIYFLHYKKYHRY